MKKMILTLISLLLICSACVSNPVENPVNGPQTGDDGDLQTGKVDYDPNPEYSPEELDGLVLGHNQFALALYKLLAEKDKNLVYSPYSLYQALTMLYAGAAGETASQFEQALALSAKNPDIHRLMNALNLDLVQKNENMEESEQAVLEIANALWVQKDAEILQSYLDTISENYAAGLRSLDFANAQKAADLINQWAAEATNEKITEIARPDMFSADTQLALTNAVYFKGAWAQQFEESGTRNEDFMLLDGTVISVPTMITSGNFPVRVNEHYQMIEMPYKGSNIAMDLIMPLDGDWDHFEEMSAENLQSYLTDMVYHLVYQDVILSMPKFKIETPEINMIDPMIKLGLVDVFGEDANLSGMNGKEDLYVSTLVQKAYIDVNEAGSEAAAVTIAVVAPKGAPSSQEPIEMRFDHPFMFVIRDTKTGTILFIGQLMQP